MDPARADRQRLGDNVAAKGSSSCEISRVIQSLPFTPSIHDQCGQREQYSICAVEISASFKKKIKIEEAITERRRKTDGKNNAVNSFKGR